jgi:organic radical activating enzyme
VRKAYKVNEVFYSVQGEGKRAGTANVFIRFAACNMKCAMEAGPKSPGGFDCDTEFESGRACTPEELVQWIDEELARHNVARVRGCWLILTGGEPALQLDYDLCQFLHSEGFLLAIETNGSIELPRMPQWPAETNDPTKASVEIALSWYAVDWITLSPKVAEHAVRQLVAHELKYVRGAGQSLPKPSARALHKLVSPSFNGLVADRDAIRTCVDLVKQNPEWSLSVQLHKSWGVR